MTNSISVVPNSFKQTLGCDADGKSFRFFTFFSDKLNSSCRIVGHTALEKTLFIEGHIVALSRVPKADEEQIDRGCGHLEFYDGGDEHRPFIAAFLYIDDITYSFLWETSFNKHGYELSIILEFRLPERMLLENVWDVSEKDKRQTRSN